jgi:DNA polymerase I
MTELTHMHKSLIVLCDYTGVGNDKYFLFNGAVLVEVSCKQLVEEAAEIICHDFWLIAPNIYKKVRQLPLTVVDLDELSVIISGNKADRELRDSADISKHLHKFVSRDDLRTYNELVNKSRDYDVDVELNRSVLFNIAQGLLNVYDHLKCIAIEAGEWSRYEEIEKPIFNYLMRSSMEGISIDEENLQLHKNSIDFDYYFALKNFSSRYKMPLELPSDIDVINYLEPKGFDFDGVDVNYVLNFVPMQDEFAVDLLHLRKLASSRKVLASIPKSQRKIFPIVDVFGSITSRIYFKDPSLQNLAKKHRNIIVADAGHKLAYVDYAQYEAGIMAALSGDKVLLNLYATEDLYSVAAEKIFKDVSKRKVSKRLFLSYAYGMKRKNLISAAIKLGAEKDLVRNFFNQFSEFEAWKASVISKFREENKIGTSLGNYMVRDSGMGFTEKESRSAVSQVVQGTASLIFKKLLLELSAIQGFKLIMPMHDAVLFQHARPFDVNLVVETFSSVMTNHFDGAVNGKAEVADFVIKEIC